LEILDLSMNKISDISKLPLLPVIEEIWLNTNNIQDFHDL